MRPTDDQDNNVDVVSSESAMPPPPPPPPPQQTAEEIIFEAHQVDHGDFVPYHPIKARSLPSAFGSVPFTSMEIDAYIESLHNPTSTLEEFESMLQLPSKGKDHEFDPFRPLFRAIHDDTLSLFDVIRVSLRNIREGTLDEDKMQKQVSFWRNLLHQLHFSFAELDQRLLEFVHFAYDSEAQPLSIEARQKTGTRKLVEDMHSTLKNGIELIDKSYDSLRAEMQIVDSRRSIAEAESVAKLTELAFVFIPLSFVASLFSMQVHELSDGVPLYLFALVAIAFVTIAYAVRLSIRSSRLLEYKNDIFAEIREGADLLYNEPIPTHTFLKWFWATTSSLLGKGIWKSVTVCVPILLVVAVIAAILSPIILLWLRNIDKGFSAVITALLLLLDCVLVYPVIATRSGKLEFNPGAFIREIRANHEIKKRQKKKLRKLRKKQAAFDPEATGVESDSDDEEFDELRGDISDTSSI
jgi:hypothetical protein